MKHKIVLLLFTVLTLSAFGQKGVRLYGFYREVTPGMVPKGVQENGRPVAKKDHLVEHIIYLSAPAKTHIHVVEVWINGTAFAATSDPVSTPVQIKDMANNRTTLVPKTSSKVYKLQGREPVESRFSNARKKAEANDLVVVYSLNGKYYSSVLKRMSRLETFGNE